MERPIREYLDVFPYSVRLVAAALLASALSVASAGADIARGPAGLPSAPGVVTELRSHPALERAAELRHAGESGSVAAMLAAVDGSTIETSVPATAFPQALASLRSAVLAAHVEVGNAVPASVRNELRRAVGDLLDGKLTGRNLRPGQEPRVSAELEGLSARIDGTAISDAAQGIAEAIDGLVAAGSGLPSATADSAAGACDILEQKPYICVSGQGANTYPPSAHHWLTVDLGGDDRYENQVAAAGPCIEQNPEVKPREDDCVSVLVDLAGNDVYDAPGNPGLLRTQGVGITGIGILVDGGGNDTYRATLTPTSGGPCGAYGRCGSVLAQGFALVGGVGVLADLDGTDSYSASIPLRAGEDDPETWGSVAAQAYSNFGVALLWDAGVANERYEISGPASGYLVRTDGPNGFDPRSASAYFGQGSAWGGPAVVVDGGGTDQISLTTQPGPGAASSRAVSPYGEGAGVQLVAAQAFGVDASSFGISGGALVMGAGDTQYVMDVSARFYASVMGQHRGSEQNLLDDPTGDDLYRIAANIDGAIDERCDCPEVTLELLPDPIVSTYAYVASAIVSGQGQRHQSVGKNAGLMHDAAGNDRYEVKIRSNLDATAESTAPGGQASAVASQLGFVASCTQACGSDILNEGGDDRYLTSVSSRLGVHAKGQGPTSAVATLRPVQIQAQAAALGRLVDVGGTDRFEVVARPQTVVTPAGGLRDDGTPFYVTGHGLYFQGGQLVDADAGEADHYSIDSINLTSTCHGTRYGESPGWLANSPQAQCTGQGGGVTGSSLAPGRDTVLSFIAVEPKPGPPLPTADVTVRLTDSAGAPLPGRRVSVYLLGADHGGQTLVTDQDGLASGRVLLATPMKPPPASTVRLRAVFFGAPGELRPAVVTSASFPA